MLINFLKNMENNNFDFKTIFNELTHEVDGRLIIPSQERIDEIFNSCIREIQNQDNSYDKKLYILNHILAFTFFSSKYKNKILYDTLINEINATQDNDYKYGILCYMGRYSGHEEQLYNHSIDLINNQNYNNRINKALLLAHLLYEPIIIQNHEDELFGLLQEFHDEIVNTEFLINHIIYIYRKNINLFGNHRQYVEDLYNERQQIEERERMKGKRERRATFYNENKPLTSFMQEIMCPMCISIEDFESISLKKLVSNVDNAYVALREDKDNIELQNNLATARNEFLNTLKTLNNEDKECLLTGIYQDLEEPVIYIMETNNKKHNINEELKEKTGISVNDLVEIFKQREQNNNLEENFIEIAQMPQPQVQELHDNNNINIVQEENNNEQNQEVQNIQEEIQEIIQEVQQQRNNNQQQNGHFVERLQKYNQNKHGRCSCM